MTLEITAHGDRNHAVAVGIGSFLLGLFDG